MKYAKKRNKKMILEGLNGHYRTMTLEYLGRMTRSELVEWLEFRGTACYDDEPTELLRQCAVDDWIDENADQA
tara:strand:- start:287 stop:505 length:219 start_codon:yes stop_codon:yes gene_type:complete